MCMSSEIAQPMVAFTTTLSIKDYGALTDIAQKYNIKSKSKAVAMCIRKAFAHEQMLDAQNLAYLQRKIMSEVEVHKSQEEKKDGKIKTKTKSKKKTTN